MAVINRPMHLRTTDSPRGYFGTPLDMESSVMRPAAGLDGPHSFGCALVTRSGACDCTDLRTTSRGFTYDLGQMLGEGWYGDEDGS